MLDLRDKNSCPSLEEIGQYVGKPAFIKFCSEMRSRYQCSEKLEFSSCSWEKGWNIKYRKAGKTLCTIYPRELYFTVMVAVGQKEKEAVQAVLEECTPQLQDIYERTREGNGQRWLMIDLEEEGGLYQDVFRLISIRRSGRIQREASDS